MNVTDIHEAETQFARLVEQAERGEQIVIGRAGRPVAKLVPFRSVPFQPRIGGGWQGRLKLAADFDELPADLVAVFGVAAESGDVPA